jgi:hypothetical protein
MLDDTSKLLCGAGQEAGHVGKGNNGDLESIAEANEASSFDTRVNVEAASENLGLVSHNTHGLSFHFNEASDHVLGEVGHNLVELVTVRNSLDYGQHVVGLVGVLGDDVVQNFSRALVFFVLCGPFTVGTFVLAALGKERE